MRIKSNPKPDSQETIPPFPEEEDVLPTWSPPKKNPNHAEEYVENSTRR